MTYLVDRERGDSEADCPQELQDFIDEAHQNELDEKPVAGEPIPEE